MQKLDKEISFIHDARIRNSALVLQDLLPEYFWVMPASTTGKYHPEVELGEGGLLRHSKAVTRIGYELLKIEMFRVNYTEHERDLILFSLMFHDGLKLGRGGSQYTVFEHPIEMANFIKENKNKLELSEEEIELICGMIGAHSGEWNTNSYSNVVLPKPKTKMEKFVHMCDYLASRKFMNIKFIDNEIEGE